MLYIFAVQLSLSPLEMVKITRSSWPAFNVPCQLPERSCASPPVPNIATSTTVHSSGLFMECPPTNAGLGANLTRSSVPFFHGCREMRTWGIRDLPHPLDDGRVNGATYLKSRFPCKRRKARLMP